MCMCSNSLCCYSVSSGDARKSASESLRYFIGILIMYQVDFKGALYIIQILCRRYTFWSYPAGLTIADPPGRVFFFGPEISRDQLSIDEFCGLRLTVRVEVLGTVNPNSNPNRIYNPNPNPN